MKLYEINERLDELLSSLTVDSETGEVTDEQFDLMAEIDALQIERQELLEYLAKKVLNLRGEQTAIKAEEDRLEKRRKRIAAAEESITNVLARECNGQKTDLGVATVRFTASEGTVVTDEAAAIQWLYSNHHSDCVKLSLPTVDKTKVKKLLKGGESIPGANLESRVNCSVK